MPWQLKLGKTSVVWENQMSGLSSQESGVSSNSEKRLLLVLLCTGYHFRCRWATFSPALPHSDDHRASLSCLTSSSLNCYVRATTSSTLAYVHSASCPTSPISLSVSLSSSVLLLILSSPVIANHEISAACYAPGISDKLRIPHKSLAVRAAGWCRSGRNRR